MDYSSTVNLPQTRFPMKADLPKREPELLARWESEKVYDEALERRRGKPSFILHDGPPYANGHLHLGHALNKILKDLIVRFKTMSGHFAPYVPGWDCHGLPIELQLMKELKITDKHKVDRAKFREQARAFAERFVGIQREEFKRMGVQGHWRHPYLTMAERYEKVIIETFEALARRGYIYRGKKPVYWCATDETALAEAEVEYENDSSPSIYVAFPLISPGRLPGPEWTHGAVSFVVWTTTPWTLPANVAIAFNPSEPYVLVEDSAGPRRFIVGAKRLEPFQQALGRSLKEVGRTAGEAIDGALARHPWIEERSVRLLPADFVAMDTGTGLVHIAPGHGMEDFQLGQKFGLPTLSPVDDRGRFTAEVPRWQGLHVFKANPLILEFLKETGALIHSEDITHSYPHCWRCHKPVLFRATEQWFLKIGHEDLRARLLKAMDTVEWIPAYGRSRMAGMIASRPDWCLSRQRLWGTEIPSKEPQKEPDIVDVWFESGVSWAAVLRQPSPWPELRYPADLYLEGSDQHRGWFQTSLIPSVALEGRAPYKAVLTHGFVMDGQGRPMSKSLGNVISPDEVIRQYGADILRLWVASSDYGGDVRLSPEILKGLTDAYRKVRNTFRYLLGNLAGFDPARDAIEFAQMLPLDRWALSKLRAEAAEAQKAYAAYEFHRASGRLIQFCANALSGFYLDVIKDRLYCDAPRSASRRSAQTALWHLAEALMKLWAPVLAFTADEAWRESGRCASVHLEDMPAPDPAWNDLAFDAVFPVREKILEALEKARQAGLIKGNLEAKVVLFGGPNGALLEQFRNEWAALCIVSQAEIRSSALADPDGEVHGIQVKIARADGRKCARCWIYKADVGADARWPEICARCAAVLEESTKGGVPA